MQLPSFIYERALNGKQTRFIASSPREIRGSSDHIGKLQNLQKLEKKSLKNKEILKINNNERGIKKFPR